MSTKSQPLFVVTHFDGPRLPEPVESCWERQPGTKSVAFRLFCDDGRLLARGRVWDDGSEEEAFAPLEWGAAEFGAARMDLFEQRPGGEWKWGTL